MTEEDPEDLLDDKEEPHAQEDTDWGQSIFQ